MVLPVLAATEHGRPQKSAHTPRRQTACTRSSSLEPYCISSCIRPPQRHAKSVTRKVRAWPVHPRIGAPRTSHTRIARGVLQPDLTTPAPASPCTRVPHTTRGTPHLTYCIPILRRTPPQHMPSFRTTLTPIIAAPQSTPHYAAPHRLSVSLCACTCVHVYMFAC